MKSLLRVFFFCLLAAGLRAAAPHPTVLTVKYKDAMLPVVKVIGTDPVVLVDGQEKRIRTDPVYLPQRTESFGGENVQFLSVALGGMELRMAASPEDEASTTLSTGPRFGTSYFEATLKSKNTLQGGFAVVVVYSPSTVYGEPSPYNHTEVIVHDLPVLPAGEEVKVKFSAALPDGHADQKYFVQIFDASGREALTNTVDNAWAYYRLMELKTLQAAVARYRQKFAGENHAAAPVMMTRPILPEGLARPTEPVTVRLTISADGLVTDLDLEGAGEHRLHQCLTEALRGWLFLPRLKAGEPVPCRVEVPIQF
jgi:hypothetical protein